MQNSTIFFICFSAIYYLVFVQHERMLLFHFIFLFLLILGPEMPTALYGLSLLEVQGDVFLFGGYGSTYNAAIYQLSCSSGICSWSTVNQVLKVGRRYTVVIPVSDTSCLWTFYSCKHYNWLLKLASFRIKYMSTSFHQEWPKKKMTN